MRATLKFKTDQGTDWVVTKDFISKRHKENFINYIERTKGYILDEIYTQSCNKHTMNDYLKKTKA